MGSNSICAITLRPYCLFSYEPEERLRGGVAEGQRQAARLSRANALASEVLIDKKKKIKNKKKKKKRNCRLGPSIESPLRPTFLPLNLLALHLKSTMTGRTSFPVPPIPLTSHCDRAAEIHATYVNDAETVWFDVDSQAYALSLSATQQPEFSPELEELEAKNAEMMRKDKMFIARDLKDVPMLAYFPQVLEPTTVAATYCALNEYVTTAPFNREHDATLPKESRRDQRHPFSQKLFELFGPRHSIRHCGMWHATGHPHERPSVSKDAIRTATLVHATTVLLSHLVLLTVELSILFSAFDVPAWSAARWFIAALNHFNPDFGICRAGEFECWAHRALLFNLETHAHRDLRDDRNGYAVISVFGSFVGGDFVVPSLGLKFSFQPGDVIFIKGQMLQHFITPWSGETDKGERFCITHFRHQSLVDSVAKASQAKSSIDN